LAPRLPALPALLRADLLLPQPPRDRRPLHLLARPLRRGLEAPLRRLARPGPRLRAQPVRPLRAPLLRPVLRLPDPGALPAHRGRKRRLGLPATTRPHHVDVDDLRAPRVGRRRLLRRGP